MKLVCMGAALAALLMAEAHAAEIVSTSARNIATNRWQIDVAFRQDTNSNPNNQVHLIEMIPEKGGDKCVRLNPDFSSGTIKYSITCRGVTWGSRYMTLRLRTLNHKNQDKAKVYLK